MTITKRRLLTIFFFLLFLVLAPAIIFYANGNILSEGWNMLATGGIFIRSMESGAELFVNGKSREITGFFTRDYLLKNLKPAVYDIEVKKEGYNSWKNKIIVKANRVVESNVFMLPIKIDVKEILEFLVVENSISTSTKNIQKENPNYKIIEDLFADSDVSSKYLSILSTTTGTTTKYILGTKENPIKNRRMSIWSESGDVFIGWTGSVGSSPRIFCAEEDNIIICNNKLRVYSFQNDITNLEFFPGESEVVIVAVADHVFAIEAEENPEKILQVIYKGKEPDFRILNNLVYIKDGDFLGQVDL